VIDANLLRKAHVVRSRQERYRSHGEQIIIADVVWSELVANTSWESTLRASFREIAHEPGALVASWSVLTMISDEHATGDPATRIVHPLMTAFVRQLVVDVAADAPGTMSQLRTAVRKHGVTEKPALAARRRDATIAMVELSRRDIPPGRFTSVNKALQGGDRQPLIELVADAFRPEMLAGSLVRQGVTPENAAKLTVKPTVTSVRSLLLTHMALEWTARKGVEGARADRIYNDFVDSEYALIAWLCGGDYVTEDKRALARFEDVRTLCDRIWPYGQGQARF
jgi:hypothetical protein